jgi:hypothetical protein
VGILDSVNSTISVFGAPTQVSCKAEFEVTVKSMDCGNRTMNNDMYDALKSEEYRFISYELKQVRIMNTLPGNTLEAMTQGILTVAGRQQSIQMRVKLKPIGGGKYNIEGKKDILGFYIAESEGSHFWLSVLNDLKVRGVEDILIACIDGLKGFPEAISSTFPNTEIQLCIVHQIRNSLKYIGSSNQKEFLRDLKTIYQSSNKDTALQNLYLLDEKWGKKYPLAIKPWLTNWDNLSCYFKFSPDIRRLIYTTNPIEGFHRQVRKYTKTKGAFTSEIGL